MNDALDLITLSLRPFPRAVAGDAGARTSADAGDERSYLVVIEAGTSSIVQLPAVGELVVGRAPDAGVRLEDHSVSRHHARLTLGRGGARVADLGSRHGTRVNGEPLGSERPLLSGDAIGVGGALLVLCREARPLVGRPILDLPGLRRRLDEEIERALRYGRPLAVACLALGASGSQPGAGASAATAAQAAGPAIQGMPAHAQAPTQTPSASIDRTRVLGALTGRLRAIDAAGFLGESELAVVMPELAADEAAEAVARWVGAISPVHPGARAGLVTCPDDGDDADTLLSGAAAAAAAQAPGVLGTAEAGASTLTVGDSEIVVADPAMRRIYDLVRKLAQSVLPVLVTGETGAGKELVAAALHAWSSRTGGPLVSLNCAALPESLVESELFGYERGAFSGAQTRKPGLIESATGGTLFLDEVGELPLGVQAKLLRVLETGRLVRLGDVREREVDVRLVAATNRDLGAEVAARRFREDLMYRLVAARVVLPPLRDRRREIGLLARHLLAQACRRAGRPSLVLSAAAVQALLAHRWPGNVRELRNAIDYAVATADPDAGTIEPWHLPDTVVPGPAATGEPAGANRGAGAGESASAGADAATSAGSGTGASGDGNQAENGGPTASAPSPGAASTAHRFRPIDDEVRELERARMIEALRAAGGVQTRAAKLISMPLRTFVTKLKLYQIETPRRDA